jgi:hypothetical protein
MSCRSVDLLVKDVNNDHIPSKDSVIFDYGFINCKTEDEKSNLLSIYTCLIKYIKCSIDDLHDACISGTLKKFIISQYGKVTGNKGYYYEWFLENSHIVKKSWHRSYTSVIES